LETVDDTGVDAITAVLKAATLSEDNTTAQGPVHAKAFVVSLHALAGIRREETMLLPVTINGVRLIALLDSGSTHNFLSVATMRCLGLQPSGADQLSVTIANSDRLAYQGIARQVPILIGDEHFSINYIGIDLGCFDIILGVDFLHTLGHILWDFDARTLIFGRLGRCIRWEGVGGASPVTPQL
jgi:hypothetical protein